MAELEADIEEAFVGYAASKGCKAWKLVELDNRHFPDRLIQMPWGTFDFAIEFKKPKTGKASKGQEKRIKELQQRGLSVYVIDKLSDAEALLDCFLGRRNK